LYCSDRQKPGTRLRAAEGEGVVEASPECPRFLAGGDHSLTVVVRC
jgi:hypothetical protein